MNQAEIENLIEAIADAIRTEVVADDENEGAITRAARIAVQSLIDEGAVYIED